MLATMQLYKSVQVAWEHDVRCGRYRYTYPRSWVRKYGISLGDTGTSYDGDDVQDSGPIILASGARACLGCLNSPE